MKIGITTNISAGIGLATEYSLLEKYLEDRDHEVFPFQFDEDAPEQKEPLDLMISLETVCRHLLDLAPVNWLIPNPEWTKPCDLDLIRRSYNKILCKTREGERIFKQYFPDMTHYVGFLAKDQFDPSIPREKIFLHIGGNSSFRGTQEVLDAWKWKKDDKGIEALLIIVSKALSERPELPNVIYKDRISDEEIRNLQNRCRFHLYPSGTEGFGHAIREGMSVNATVVTTAAPPMDEIQSAHKIPATGWSTYNLAKVYEVSALDIHTAVQEILSMEPEYLSPLPGGAWQAPPSYMQRSREEFLRGNEFFETAFGEHLEDFVPRSLRMSNAKLSGKMRISFLGNFAAEHSTENQILWALKEGLGHEVDTIQENEATLRKIDLSCRNSDVFLWVRTPGWLKVDNGEMLDWLKRSLVKTASIHLDKFWGIPDREALIGVHPFWKTDCVFTADGSREEDFKARGVNHHWMQPAVSEVYVHPGIPREAYRCDVGFVGARDYHKEYPFRAQMIQFLEKTYGPRFKHVTGVRGHELNDVYASMKIVVGDCIFAGTPRYWSDRVPETIGRHGFLLHPEVEGMTLPCAIYEPQNLQSLKENIDLWFANEAQRKEVINMGVGNIRDSHTWTVRLREILETING
jgi:glycosyltransferase involved in cell wall biosynthesis